MSKDFDAALTDALDGVARAALSAGPAAARIRGRKRILRKRIALSTASLVLIAAGATTAFKATSWNNGAPSSSTSSAGASNQASPAPTAASRPAGADPHQVIAGAWLTASQMPFASTFSWKTVPASLDSEQPLTSTVGYIASNASYQALTVCGDPAAFLQRTIGAQIGGFDTTPTSAGEPAATQYVFFFADAPSAQQAYVWLQSQYTSDCGGIAGTGAQITQVGSDGTTGTAWLTRKAASSLPDLPVYEREYFVQRGSTIAYVSVISRRQNLPVAYDDAGELSTIAAHLCVYGGPCK